MDLCRDHLLCCLCSQIYIHVPWYLQFKEHVLQVADTWSSLS